jgi:hypothetical protein
MVVLYRGGHRGGGHAGAVTVREWRRVVPAPAPACPPPPRRRCGDHPHRPAGPDHEEDRRCRRAVQPCELSPWMGMGHDRRTDGSSREMLKDLYD